MDEKQARPYTDMQVFELEIASAEIARLLHNEWAPAFSYRRIDEDVLEALVYDALVALRNEMAMEGE